MYKRAPAFTLLELMVAILIISLLLAVSGPIYTSYKVKSRFVEVLGTINQYRDDLETAFADNDKFPSSFANITAGSYIALSSNVLQQVYYGKSTDSQAAYMQFFTIDLGISGFVESNNTGTGGVSCRVTLAAVTNSTGQTQFYCGQWDGSSMDVPLTYLPKSCQDTNISALIT